MIARDHSGGGRLYRLGQFRRQSFSAIDPRRSLFDDGERVDDPDRHALHRSEGKIFDAALGLRAPIGACRHLYGADAVGFRAAFHAKAPGT